jgi:hypothetical protein
VNGIPVAARCPSARLEATVIGYGLLTFSSPSPASSRPGWVAARYSRRF